MKRILLLLAAQFTVMALYAQEPVTTDVVNDVVATTDLGDMADDAVAEKKPFLPTSRRVDRNINKNKFVYRHEVMFGIAASYGTLNASDADILMLLDGIDFGLRRAQVMPYVAYAYRDNSSVGLRFGYEFLKGDIGNLALDLSSIMDDLNFGISNIGLKSESFAWSLFHRNYIGLDRRGIVGAILESELQIKTGTSSFSMGAGEDINYSQNKNFTARLNFNPGLAVYVFPEVCVTVTVGIGGLKYNQVRQLDAYGEEMGRRSASSLKFKLNIADIQVGVVAHLWNKKNK